jgi:hypothetical protein
MMSNKLVVALFSELSILKDKGLVVQIIKYVCALEVDENEYEESNVYY